MGIEQEADFLELRVLGLEGSRGLGLQRGSGSRLVLL